MTFYRIDDRTAGQSVLVNVGDTEGMEGAVAKYLEDYPPDLMVTEATDAEVEEWIAGDMFTPWVL